MFSPYICKFSQSTVVFFYKSKPYMLGSVVNKLSYGVNKLIVLCPCDGPGIGHHNDSWRKAPALQPYTEKTVREMDALIFCIVNYSSLIENSIEKKGIGRSELYIYQQLSTHKTRMRESLIS